MNCEDIRELIDPLIDGELLGHEQRLLDEHVTACPDCQALVSEAQKLRAAVRSVPRIAAPQSLRSSISDQLDTVDLDLASKGRQSKSFRIATHVAALAAGVVLTLLTSQFVVRQDRLLDELLTTHLRAVATQQFGTVKSADSHTVRPWFTGKIDYAPPVIDLAAQGFPLHSGRIEYIDRHGVAVLTYGRRKHKISLFILPPEIGSAFMLPASGGRGLHVQHWRTGDLSFAAVSDVNINDLEMFANLMRKK